jgi:biopolymer transport protein ExbB
MGVCDVLVTALIVGAGFLAQADAAPAAPSVRVQSVWDFIVKGGPMMVPIGLCSLIALTVIIERLVSLRRRRVIPPKLMSGLREVFRDPRGDREQGLNYCQADDSPLATVLATAIRRFGEPVELLERHIQESGQRAVVPLGKNLRVLSVIAAIAPLLGLLGTIFGMINAFQTVAASGEALGKTELLAEGIYEAMITTAAGLMVAIPVLLAYHWISARIESLVAEVDRVTVEFVEELVPPESVVSVRSVARADLTLEPAAIGSPDGDGAHRVSAHQRTGA